MGLVSDCEKTYVENRQLLPLLVLEPILNAHSICVCEMKPGSRSLAVVSKDTGRIEGALVTGRPELGPVQGYWLSASTGRSFELLINELEPQENLSINYPIWGEGVMRQCFPRACFTHDCLYVFPMDKTGISLPSRERVTQLTHREYWALSNKERFRGLLLPEDLLPESKFFGIIVDSELRAIGEFFLESEAVCVIGQLVTLPEYRGRGYAADIVGRLTMEILKRGKIPVGFFSEENSIARRINSKLGFVLHSRLGFMERVETD